MGGDGGGGASRYLQHRMYMYMELEIDFSQLERSIRLDSIRVGSNSSVGQGLADTAALVLPCFTTAERESRC